MGTVTPICRDELANMRRALAANGQDAAAWWAECPLELRKFLVREARLPLDAPNGRAAAHGTNWPDLSHMERGRILRAVDEIRSILNDTRRALL